MVRLDGFPGRGEFPVVHKGPALIVKTPQLTGDKLTVARKESRRSGRLVLVKRFAFWIGCRITRGTDVVELEIGVSGHQNHPIMRSQARNWKRIARQVHRECRSSTRVVSGPKLPVR